MSEALTKNNGFSKVLMEALRLEREPVAIKLIKKGGEYPACCQSPAQQLSHCQAVMSASEGNCLKMTYEMQGCHIGASALNMQPTPDKVASGDFHFGIGMHDSPAAAGKMISDRKLVPFESEGEAVCPLSKADYEPDIVAIVGLPESIYWVVPMMTAKKGGRAEFSTSPFQCMCEDVTAYPMNSEEPNISLGCFGCRKKTDMRKDELACGIPYALIPDFVEHLTKYSGGVMAKAKRD